MDPEHNAGTRRARRRAGPAIAVSLLIHAVILLAIGVVIPRPQFYTPPDLRPVNVLLVPPPVPRTPRPTPLPNPQPGPQSPKPAPAPARLNLHLTPTPNAAAPPEAVAPVAAQAPGPPAEGDNVHFYARSVPGCGKEDLMLMPPEEQMKCRALLRGPVGCDPASAAHQTAQEKAACIQRFGDAAMKAAPFSGVPAEKRA